MNDIYTFYKLIREYKIEIPVIQRDYAQGRAESKAVDVRKKIVASIIESVTNNGNKHLFFDFVYGRIEGETFIPFDGQQRLTTLFLFHRYIFEKCKCNSDCMSLLYRFTYTTRQSSREFCEQLVSNNIIPPCKYQDKCMGNETCPNYSISEYIKDQPWFYPDWSKDPTIMGMLTMLDEIDNQFKVTRKDFKDIAQKLTSECVCPITFHFVNMGKHNMLDSTYIKMNARGKSLTSFENFKASLEEYLEINKSILKEEFVKNIDGKWLDLFYNETKPNVPDLVMLSLFKRHFLNCYIVNDGYDNDVITVLENQLTSDDFIPFSVFEKAIGNNIDEIIEPLFKLLKELDFNYDVIMKNSLPVWCRDDYKVKNDYATLQVEDKERYNSTIWNLIIGNWNKKGQKSQDEESEGSERYQSRVVFYAVVKYFEKTDNFDETQFSQWMRVIWNYTENVQFNSFEDYKKDLKLVDSISSCLRPNCDFNSEFAKCSGLNSRQSRMNEELIKAHLIASDSAMWKRRIYDLEKHKYFTGEIKFMFDFLGNTPNVCLFDSYSEIMREIFDCQGLNKDYDVNGDYIFRRALMYCSSSYSFGYYKGQNWSFLKNKDRDVSWKRFISDSNDVGKDNFHNQALKFLLEGIRSQINNGKSYLYAFNYLLSYSANVRGWRHYFIESAGVWRFMSDDKYVRWYSESEIYLMKTTRMSGKHSELRTYYLYQSITAVPNSWTKKYYEVDGKDEQPCLYFEKKVGGNTFAIDICWDVDKGGGYYLNLFTRDNSNANVTPIVNANTTWGLVLSDPTNPDSRYVSGLLNEVDVVTLAKSIMVII